MRRSIPKLFSSLDRLDGIERPAKETALRDRHFAGIVGRENTLKDERMAR